MEVRPWFLAACPAEGLRGLYVGDGAGLGVVAGDEQEEGGAGEDEVREGGTWMSYIYIRTVLWAVFLYTLRHCIFLDG